MTAYSREIEFEYPTLRLCMYVYKCVNVNFCLATNLKDLYLLLKETEVVHELARKVGLSRVI